MREIILEGKNVNVEGSWKEINQFFGACENFCVNW
jgi:hypothetical protein